MAARILIVDDEENNRDLIKKSLRKEDNLELYEACNGDEAIAKAKELKPRLIILDIMMPGKTGYEVCEDIRQSFDGEGPKILFLSARSTMLTRETARASGGDDFMAKPFSPRELKDKVLEMLLE